MIRFVISLANIVYDTIMSFASKNTKSPVVQSTNIPKTVHFLSFRVRPMLNMSLLVYRDLVFALRLWL